METRLNSGLSSSRILESWHEPQISSLSRQSMSKMRTGTSDRSATESWLIPIECGWDKGNNKEQEEKGKENRKSGLSSNCRKWSHNDASGWHGKEKQVNRVRSSSSFTLVATDVDTKV